MWYRNLNLCKTDGCTCFFDGSWKHCCDRHDKRYENNRLTRREADMLLYRCIKKENAKIALIVYLGVRLFGWTRYNKNNKDIK